MAKTRLLRAVALATMLAFLTTSTAFAANWTVDTRVTIKVKPGKNVPDGTQIVIKGKLKSEKKWCIRDSKVTLRRYNHGKIDSTKTDNEGRYRFELVAKHDMKLRVWFKGKQEGAHPNLHICNKSKSKTVKINVS